MAAKIVGFDKKHTTRQNLKQEPAFKDAVITAAKVLAKDDANKFPTLVQQLTTRRQAAKFFQRKGLVFDTVNGGDDGV